MTVCEVYKQVAELGFEDNLEDDNSFYSALNRALLQVNAIRPAIRSLIIHHAPMKNEIDSSFEPIEVSEELCFVASNAKAYYFEADGNGTLYIETKRAPSESWEVVKEVTLDASRSFVKYKGLIKDADGYLSGEVRFRFTGENLYFIKNVALYRYTYSDKIADVPTYEPYVRYDVSKIADDFFGFASPPIKEGKELQRLNQEYDTEGNVILLPYNEKGIYKILYKHKPSFAEMLTKADKDNTEIDLDGEDLCSLLPELVASYIWLEDNAERSVRYYNLFQARAAEIKNAVSNAAPVMMKQNGW